MTRALCLKPLGRIPHPSPPKNDSVGHAAYEIMRELDILRDQGIRKHH